MNFELLKETKTRYLFIKMLCILTLGIILMIVCSKVLKMHITDSYIEIISAVITIIWFLIALKFLRENGISISNFIRRPLKSKFILEVPVSLIITYLGGAGFILLILSLVNYTNPAMLNSISSNLSNKSPKIDTMFMIVISFISSVIIAPIVEEFIFRGILMGRLYNKYGMGKSIIFSSIIFFFMHLNINPMLLLLGISCAILAYKYKSLIPSITLHACNNLIVCIGGLKRNSGASDLVNINSSFMIGGIVLVIIYIVYSYRSYRKCRMNI